jgi:hypothetical protein
LDSLLVGKKKFPPVLRTWQPPELSVDFVVGEQKFKYFIPLPITLSHFLSPVILGAAGFATRWDMIEAGEAVIEGNTKLR